jgi:hypothetical protein
LADTASVASSIVEAFDSETGRAPSVHVHESAVDVVVVAYRSASHLRDCVEPLCRADDIRVIVVDNLCPEGSVSTLHGLAVDIVEMGRNAGFAAGCNAGARVSTAPAILFLNPDARITPTDVRLLARRLAEDESCGAVGPHILETTGETQFSMRRAPSLRSAFAEALFVHRLTPWAGWTSEIVRTGYDRREETEWLTGAALCIRRSAFEQLGGFDERMFLYCEDIDLCTRLRGQGFSVSYEPAATARHQGGGSGPRSRHVALKAESRVIYARLHERNLRYLGFRVAFLLHELVRLPVSVLRSPAHARARATALVRTLRLQPRLWESES